jgi:hypothetical protein
MSRSEGQRLSERAEARISLHANLCRSSLVSRLPLGSFSPLLYGPMIYLRMKRTTIFLAEEDRHAIRTIQRRFGVSTDSDAIRLALRVLAQAQQIAIDPLPGDGEAQKSTKS